MKRLIAMICGLALFVAAQACEACTPSTGGTTVPSATSITDSACNVWTLANGNAYENGSYANGGGNELLYYNNNVYLSVQPPTSNPWYKWNGVTGSGSSWINVGGDPRATATPTASPSPSPSPSSTPTPVSGSIAMDNNGCWTGVGAPRSIGMNLAFNFQPDGLANSVTVAADGQQHMLYSHVQYYTYNLPACPVVYTYMHCHFDVQNATGTSTQIQLSLGINNPQTSFVTVPPNSVVQIEGTATDGYTSPQANEDYSPFLTNNGTVPVTVLKPPFQQSCESTFQNGN